MDANAKLELSRSGAQIGGPGLAGVLVQWITAPFAVAVDAVSFVWSAWFIARIRTHELVERHEERNLRSEILEGLRYLLGDTRWRAMTTYVATFNLGTGITGPLILVWAVRRWHMSAGEIGLAFMLGNIGWLVAALVAQRMSNAIGLGRTLALAGFIGGAPLVLVPLAPASLAIPTLVGVEAICQFGIVVFNVNGISRYQTLVPSRMLGRMNASRRWIVWGVMPLGNVLGGVLAAQIGLRTTLLAGAIVSAVAVAALLVKPILSLATVAGDARVTGDGGVAASAE